MKKIDTHFHPNFFWKLTRIRSLEKQAKKIWKKIDKLMLDAVIVTEHVFKNPAKSYDMLMKYKPKTSKTLLIPGVESLTKEGIDLIAFSKDTSIYSCEEIMKSKHLSFDETIAYIQNNDRLYGVITHPLMLAKTGVIKHFSKEKIKKSCGKLGIVEKHNGSFLTMRKYLEKTFWGKLPYANYYLKRFYEVEDLPASYYPKDTVIFGGSDAHFVSDIGDYIMIESNEEDVWESLFDKDAKREYHKAKNRISVWRLMIRNGYIIIQERIIKTLNLCGTDTTYFNKK